MNLHHLKSGFDNLKMRSKLILAFSVITFIPLVLLSTFSYVFSGSAVKSEVVNYVQQIIDRVSGNINTVVEDLYLSSETLSENREVQRLLKYQNENQELLSEEREAAIKRLIDITFESKIWIRNVFLFSNTGQIYTYSGNMTPVAPDEKKMMRPSWFSALPSIVQNTIVLPAYIRAEITGSAETEKSFTLIKTIEDAESGEILGYILMDVNSDIFKRILDGANADQSRNFFIIDNNKSYIYHNNISDVTQQYRSPYISKLLKMRNGSFYHINDDRRQVLITFNTSEITHWTIICETPVEELYTSMVWLRKLIWVTSAICMALALLFAIVISRTISKPILRLQARMEKVEKGNFEREPGISSKDEIGQLSASFDRMVEKINNLIEDQYLSEILQKEAELNALQSQINPHFLYNTLQVIDLLAEEEGVDTISEASQALTKIFRYSINRGQEFVTLREELSHVENYVFIQKLRFDSKIQAVFDIEENCKDDLIVKLIVQPLVENAVFHGVEKKRGNCTVKITARREKDCLVIQVSDDGEGMRREIVDSLNKIFSGTSEGEIVHGVTYRLNNQSIGLKNTNSRIKLYFGSAYGLHIESEEGTGTTVTIRLPVISENSKGGYQANDQGSGGRR